MWHFAWCHELCWRNLHTQEVFTKTRTFPRKHQWQYQERRFWNVPKVKKAFGDEMEILYRMSENESLIIMNPSWNCGKNVWNKKWTRKQRQGWWVARAKWNLSIYLFIFFFLGGEGWSIYHTSFMQGQIICQTCFSRRRFQPSRERNVPIYDWHIEKYEAWWRLQFIFRGI